MSEVKGTVDRADKHHVDSINKDKWVVLVGGKSYDCWSSRIESLVGKELPAGTTMTPATNDKYNPKLNLPKEGGSFAGGKSGPRPFSTDQQKTMILSYAKDLTIAMLERSEVKHTVSAVADTVSALFEKLQDIVNKPKGEGDIPF